MRIPEVPATQQLVAPIVQSPGASSEFGEMLLNAIEDVNRIQADSRQVQTDFMTGSRPVDTHELMIAMEKSSVAFQLTTSLRNKLLESYQEIARMQV